MSLADQRFIETCRAILTEGCSTEGEKNRPRWEDGSAAYTLKRFGVVNRYDLSLEFPAVTQRYLNLRGCVEELLWIWQRKSNRLADLNLRIWDQWADEQGTIGKAYGYQLGVKHRYREGEFDQVERVLYDLRHNPYSRRIMTNLYTFADLHEMQLYPCAYSMTFNVTDGRLNGILNQRSQDMLLANAWNVAQYAVLLHMLAQVSALRVGELVHVIADAHIYDRHIELVRELIARPCYPAPRFWMDPEIRRFEDFRPDSFALEDYVHGPKMSRIPVAV